MRMFDSKSIKKYMLKVSDNVRPNSGHGFTLLEVMAALAIIAIVLVSIYKLHAQTISMNQAARFYATASLLAQSKITEFETKLPEELTDAAGNFADDFAGFRWNVAVGDVDSEVLGKTAENLKQIDVTVSLQDQPFSYHLRTYRFLND